MAKAHITTRSGTKVTVEGTPEEVALLVARFDVGEHAERSAPRTPKSGRGSSKAKTRVGPQNLISELIDGGYFKKPKGLGEIKMTLEEQGHFYPVTTLSPVLLRMVKRKELRRIKDKNRWVYVG